MIRSAEQRPPHLFPVWHLRELQEAVAIDGLDLPNLDEQVEALTDAENKLLARGDR